MANLRHVILTYGFSLMLYLGLAILCYSFYPLLKLEVSYAISPKPVELSQDQLEGLQTQVVDDYQAEYFLAIPRIAAYAPIVVNVDPSDQAIYEPALNRGVAHALGSVLPGELGHAFLFAHSSTSWQTARSVNTQFYLLDKLAVGDLVYIGHTDRITTYRVTDRKIVLPSQVEYLQGFGGEATMSLMTCYPIGTSLQRLIIQAEKVSETTRGVDE